MPNLIKLNDTSGDWEIVDQPEAIDWQSAEEWQDGGNLVLDVDAEPEDRFASATKIAINFPAFNDGRGLSLAVLLRTRVNFTGELRAIGDVHQDILHYMARCGFSSFELPDAKDAESALSLVSPYSDHYQASILQPTPAFRRVQRG